MLERQMLARQDDLSSKFKPYNKQLKQNNVEFDEKLSLFVENDEESEIDELL